MSYTPDATNASQPTGNVQLSTAAAEFRAIKQRIIDVVTAQDARDDLQDTAISTAQSTANTGVANAATAQGTANTALANAATAQGTANTGVSDAAAAQATADTALANSATAQGTADRAVAGLVGQTLTGTGNFTVPAGISQLRVTLRGGSTASKSLGDFNGDVGGGANFAFYAVARDATEVSKTVAVTAGDIIAYSAGAGQQLEWVQPTLASYKAVRESASAGNTTFGSITAARATSFYTPDSTDLVAIESATFVSSHAYDGKMPQVVAGSTGNTAPDMNTYTAGEAGYILVNW